MNEHLKVSEGKPLKNPAGSLGLKRYEPPKPIKLEMDLSHERGLG